MFDAICVLCKRLRVEMVELYHLDRVLYGLLWLNLLMLLIALVMWVRAIVMWWWGYHPTAEFTLYVSLLSGTVKQV